MKAISLLSVESAEELRFGLRSHGGEEKPCEGKVTSYTATSLFSALTRGPSYENLCCARQRHYHLDLRGNSTRDRAALARGSGLRQAHDFMRGPQ